MDPFAPEPKKPLTLWVVGAVVASCLLLLFPLLYVLEYGISSAQAAGGVVGRGVGMLLFPAIVASLFMIGRSFRNVRGWLQVYTWSGFAAFFAQMALWIPTAP